MGKALWTLVCEVQILNSLGGVRLVFCLLIIFMYRLHMFVNVQSKVK